MLKFYNSEIISIGKKLRHLLLFDIPEDINYLKLFKNKFMKERDFNYNIDRFISKKFS